MMRCAAPNDVRCLREKKMYYASRVYRCRHCQTAQTSRFYSSLRNYGIHVRSKFDLSLPREFLIILRSNFALARYYYYSTTIKIARTLGTRRVDAIVVLRPRPFRVRLYRGRRRDMSSCPSCTTSAGDRHGTRVVVMCRSALYTSQRMALGCPAAAIAFHSSCRGIYISWAAAGYVYTTSSHLCNMSYL